MRLFVLHLLLLAICAAVHGVPDPIIFSLPAASDASYANFIGLLRDGLSAGTTQVYNIPVLKHESNPNDRFILVNIINYEGKTLSLGIDVFNVYVVGFLTGTNSYFFNDAPAEAAGVLFPGSAATTLGYGGSYTDLERGAGVERGEVDLGVSPMDAAVTNLLLYNQQALPRAMLVVIQMVSEAARFKYIEKRVKDTIGNTFRPDPAVLSLENNWGALSKQIQLAQNNGGNFPNPVQLQSASGNPVVVQNVNSPVIKGIALLVYNRDTANIITISPNITVTV